MINFRLSSLNRSILKRSISRWLAEEDGNLIKLHEEYGPAWSVIATKCAGRTAVECRRRYLTLKDVIKSDDTLDKEIKREHSKIRDGWEFTSEGDCIKVPIDELGYTPYHTLAAKVPKLKHRWERKGWSMEEKRAVYEGFFEFGPDNNNSSVLSGWDRIAKGLQRRTGDQCRRLYEREFILHADSQIPEIEELKERLFADSRDGKDEQLIVMQCDD